MNAKSTPVRCVACSTRGSLRLTRIVGERLATAIIWAVVSLLSAVRPDDNCGVQTAISSTLMSKRCIASRVVLLPAIAIFHNSK